MRRGKKLLGPLPPEQPAQVAAPEDVSSEDLGCVVRTPGQWAETWIVHVLEDPKLSGRGLEAKLLAKRVHDFDVDLPEATIWHSIEALLAQGSLMQYGKRICLSVCRWALLIQKNST